MGYKISGDISAAGDVIVFDESDYSAIEDVVTVTSGGVYEIIVTSGTKTVLARGSGGETIGYGDVTPEYFIPENLTFLIHAPDHIGQAVVLETPGSQSAFADESLQFVFRSAMLPDGRVVVPGYDSNLNDPVVVKCYDAGSTTAVSWSYTIVGSIYGEYSDVCVLTNGNIVVFWVDRVAQRPYFIILNSDGGLIQGATEAEYPNAEYPGNSDTPCFVLAMADGGFFCTWSLDGTYPSATSWYADGTNRANYDYFGGDNEPSAPVQMPSGGGGTYAGWLVCSQSYSTGGVLMVNPDDMSDTEQIAINEFNQYPEYIYMFTLPSWTDKIGLVWTQTGGTYPWIKYMVVYDDGTYYTQSLDWWDQGMPAGDMIRTQITDLVVLPDETLLILHSDLMNFSGYGADYGSRYTIVETQDGLPNIYNSSDPATNQIQAFTGLTAYPDGACHGCAALVDPDWVPPWGVSMVDDTWWENFDGNNTAVWNGSYWTQTVAGTYIVLKPITSGPNAGWENGGFGAWPDSFRPEEIRITFEFNVEQVGDGSFWLRDESLFNFRILDTDVSNEDSPAVRVLDWGSGRPIWELRLIVSGIGSTFSRIINIEFRGQVDAIPQP